jgi:hypothetical protein
MEPQAKVTENQRQESTCVENEPPDMTPISGGSVIPQIDIPLKEDGK